MATQQTFRNSRLAEQWSNGAQPGDPASGYTSWDDQGTVTTQRALTPQESATLAAWDTSLTSSVNQATIQQALQQAVTYFGGNYTNWSTLNAGQKDAAAKNGQRALAQIARWLLGEFDSAG